MLTTDRTPLVECARCKHQHHESERIPKPNPKHRNLSDLVCPRCGARAYYDLKPE